MVLRRADDLFQDSGRRGIARKSLSVVSPFVVDIRTYSNRCATTRKNPRSPGGVKKGLWVHLEVVWPTLSVDASPPGAENRAAWRTPTWQCVQGNRLFGGYRTNLGQLCADEEAMAFRLYRTPRLKRVSRMIVMSASRIKKKLMVVPRGPRKRLAVERFPDVERDSEGMRRV